MTEDENRKLAVIEAEAKQALKEGRLGMKRNLVFTAITVAWAYISSYVVSLTAYTWAGFATFALAAISSSCLILVTVCMWIDTVSSAMDSD